MSESAEGTLYISNTDSSGNIAECIFDDGETVHLADPDTDKIVWKGSYDDLEYYWTPIG